MFGCLAQLAQEGGKGLFRSCLPGRTRLQCPATYNRQRSVLCSWALAQRTGRALDLAYSALVHQLGLTQRFFGKGFGELEVGVEGALVAAQNFVYSRAVEQE